MKDRETEIKYVIPGEKTLMKILSDAQTGSVAGLLVRQCPGPLSKAHIYYDTEYLDLFSAGKIFRVSAASGNTVRLTWKEQTKNPLTRIEIQDNLNPAQFRKALSSERSSRAIDALRKAIGENSLLPALRVYKLLYKLIFRNCEITFGYTVYAGGRGAKERIDLEVEAKNKTAARTVLRIGELLSAHYGLKPDMRSKYEVGLKTVGPLFTPKKR